MTLRIIEASQLKLHSDNEGSSGQIHIEQDTVIYAWNMESYFSTDMNVTQVKH